ncbi:MAG: hypothetical protein QOE61_1083 [Micromonosporaceae bacterium]|nr:hypothetical protein [Micromonosporaceae bacterium]
MTTPGQDSHGDPPVAGADREGRRSRSEGSAPAWLAGADRVGRVRIAAVGDLHLTVERAGRFRPALRRARAHADVLLSTSLTAMPAGCCASSTRHPTTRMCLRQSRWVRRGDDDP